MKNITADLIIFDLDGTLIDSSEDIAWAANMAIADLGHGKVSTEKVKEGIGWGVKSLLGKMMPDEGADRIEYARVKFLEYYWGHSVVSTYIYPGVMETIEYFSQRDTIMAVVTNKPAKFSEKILTELGIIKYFRMVLGGDSVTNRKPDPEPLEKVISYTGVERERSLIVGDSPVDCEAGKKAGIATIGVEYGFRSRKELEEAGCDVIIKKMSELINVLTRH
ncbi:MAG: HAD-IA family hydrolase [Nitrospirae bacterium]|nr:HAD-IA family hydrolase [Nitrospirota bacterium]